MTHKSINSILIMKHVSLSNEKKKKMVKVNQYAFLKKVGIGSSSKVYVAIDTNTNLYYAVKVININSSNAPQIKQEIRMMSKIIHPNVIRFKEVLYSSEKSKIFFIMEYSDIGTLSKLIDDGIKLSQEQICSIFKQITNSVAYMHSKKVTHQDIKPRNILIFSDGEAKITDFGVCHSFNSLDLMFAGSPAYQAPEIFDAFDSFDTIDDSEISEIDENLLDPAKCDIYSLGVSLYECITGNLPFEGNTLFEIADDMRNNPDIEFSPDITESMSPELLQTVKKMLEFDPNERISSNELISFFSKFKSPIPFINDLDDDSNNDTKDESSKIERVQIPPYDPNADYKIVHAEVCDSDEFDMVTSSLPSFSRNAFA